MTPWWSYR